MIAGARRYAGQSVALRKARRRQQFLGAATRVCAERGHLSCSLVDICESAGLSKRQFYEEFETLDEVLIAAYARVQDDAAVAVARTFADLTVSADPIMAVRAGLTAYFGSIDSAPYRADFAVIELRGVGGRIEQECRPHAHRWAGHILNFLEATGTRQDGDTAWLLTAVVNAIAREWLSREPALPLSILVELTTEMTMLLVARGTSVDFVATISRHGRIHRDAGVAGVGDWIR
ncbi:TetR/AcrR family transcriptional regulator [Nocardia sp. NPDC051833]|uniref:TetR/AcrR family transcriptional regulator n=1 Tax=Nocardia sp. NPDC051833 TaxID=3155674 RepID=UPI00342F26C0